MGFRPNSGLGMPAEAELGARFGNTNLGKSMQGDAPLGLVSPHDRGEVGTVQGEEGGRRCSSA